MTLIYTRHHILRQERRQFCWVIYPKGLPNLASSTETRDINEAMEQVGKLEEDLRLMFNH